MNSDATGRRQGSVPRFRLRRHRPATSRRSLLWGRSGRAVFVALVTAVMLLPWAQAQAGGYTTIDGSGSSWASVALFQWAKDVQPQGLTVNYNPDGSAQGRQDWIQGGLVDFAGSDPPFRNGDDKLAGTSAEHNPWDFSYIPDTAGGTAFIYHLTVHGHLIRNLRLSPKVIMEIFTGAITNWDNPQITQIYGAQLPSEPITPVLRADGSGATFFFTLWMSTLFPKQWNAFCEKVHPGITLPCGNTEFYPSFPGSKSENGSIASADYVTASYGEGSIDYDEYAYALNANYPVVQVLNPDNYFVGPTASNVAVALTKAQINEDSHSQDFLQQNLSNVYSFRDPRSYPLSSYSYLIVPRIGPKEPGFFKNSAGAGKSLSQYINFFLCGGQKQSADLGYSPLPLNLVKGGLLQNSYIPGHGPIANVNSYSSCPNPTFTNGKLTILLKAPYPSPCQKLGAPLNCVVKHGKAVAAGGGSGGSGGGGSSGTGGQGSGSGGSSGSNTGGTSSGNASTGSSGNLAAGTSAGSGPTTGAANVTGDVVNLASNGTDRALLGVLTALAVLMAVAAPPAVGSWLRRRKRRAGS